jgi:hypothetical protein
MKCKYCVRRYANEKMIAVETVSEWGMREKGDWWRG